MLGYPRIDFRPSCDLAEIYRQDPANKIAETESSSLLKAQAQVYRFHRELELLS